MKKVNNEVEVVALMMVLALYCAWTTTTTTIRSPQKWVLLAVARPP
jgi:hypothetical protein